MQQLGFTTHRLPPSAFLTTPASASSIACVNRRDRLKYCPSRVARLSVRYLKGANNCSFTLTRTWAAEDLSSNSAQGQRTYQVADTEPPVRIRSGDYEKAMACRL